jgi:bla regulator protein blaR1
MPSLPVTGPAAAHPRPLGRRASGVYRLALAVAALGALAAAGGVFVVLRGLNVQSAHVEHLRVLGQHLTAPAINLAAAVTLPLAALGLASVIQGTRSCARQIVAQRRFLNSLVLSGRLPSHPEVRLVAHDQPQAFCAGHLHPRIFVSTGAVRMLDAAELDAVLAHEAHHRLRRDPLRIAAARGLCDALFFLPVLRRLTERYCALAELSADEAAVGRLDGDPAPLASAMLTFGSATDPAVVGIAPERVDHLLGRPPGWGLPCVLLALSAAAVTLIGLLAWQVGRSALITTSLSLPLLSSQPCVIVLAVVPFVLSAAAVSLLRRGASSPRLLRAR